MVGILCLMPLLMSGEINSSNGVGIKDWTWKVVHCTDGDLISIDYVMTNNTPHKIINAQFEVILWGTSLTTILNNDSRQLAKVIRKDLDDVGYSFCPSNSVHKSGVDVALQKYMSSTVKSVSLTLNELMDIPLVCFYTGVPLSLKTNEYTTVSLDRLDNEKGYTKNNVVFCCRFINVMKSTLSYDQFVTACGTVFHHCSTKSIRQ